MEIKKTYLFLILLLFSALVYSQTPGTIKWETKFTAGTLIRSSPAIDTDGNIYVISLTNGVLYSFYPDGSKKWVIGPDSNMPIYHSSPAIAIDGTIYLNAQYEGKLYAINPNGNKKWEYLIGSYSVSTPAIGADGTIYVGSLDFKLHAINPDGTKKWEYLSSGDVYTSAIGADGTIYYCGSNHRFCAVNPDGTKKWEYSVISPNELSPAISTDGTLYFSCGSGINKLYAINSNGEKKWEYLASGSPSTSPVIDVDGTIYFGAGSKLIALSLDGNKKWEFITGSGKITTPAIGVDGTIYFGSSDSCLYAINNNGTIKWKYLSGGEVYSSPSIAMDGTVYFGTDNSKLYALYSSSNGLANSPWPKYQHDNSNSGHFTGFTVLNGEFSNMALPSQTYDFKVNIYNTFISNLTIKALRFSEVDFSISTPLPFTVVPGKKKEVILSLSTPKNKWYKPKISIDYTVDGVNCTKESGLEGVIFLDDNSELAHFANQVMPVWKTLDKRNEIIFNNTKGVIYRLLSDYSSAENCFNVAVSKAIISRYAFSGIMINQGVVKSDRMLSDSANFYYSSALKTIQIPTFSSVHAPQIYYNQAWELYKKKDYSYASGLALLTINHTQANNYLKAKAYTLLGAIRYDEGKINEAKVAFNQAIILDKDGPIGKMANENLKEISTTVIDINTNNPDLRLYPNPSNGKIKISTGNVSGIFNVNVINNAGEKVFSTKLNCSAFSSQNLDLSHLVDGMYFISIASQESVFTNKIVIIKK